LSADPEGLHAWWLLGDDDDAKAYPRTGFQAAYMRLNRLGGASIVLVLLSFLYNNQKLSRWPNARDSGRLRLRPEGFSSIGVEFDLASLAGGQTVAGVTRVSFRKRCRQQRGRVTHDCA
jgi:hypothetical protein